MLNSILHAGGVAGCRVDQFVEELRQDLSRRLRTRAKWHHTTVATVRRAQQIAGEFRRSKSLKWDSDLQRFTADTDDTADTADTDDTADLEAQVYSCCFNALLFQ